MAYLRKLGLAIGAGLLSLLITALAGGTWSLILAANLTGSPAVPWGALLMALLLWLMWQYLGGRWLPRSTSPARRRLLRAKRVSFAVYGWAFAAGALAVVALAGLWIVFGRLIDMTGNVIPGSQISLDQVARYPLLTVVLSIIMGSLVSPFSEEAAFRGYCQRLLQPSFSVPASILIASFFFMLAHIPTAGLWLPKLLIYFVVGAAFGAIAELSDSILPVIPVHILGDLTFFIFVWPFDSARHTIWSTGADLSFWLHVAQVIGFGLASLWAFRRLARASRSPATLYN